MIVGGVVMIGLSLSGILQWASLCKEVRVELREAVKAELISERDMNRILDNCRRYEEKERKNDK